MSTSHFKRYQFVLVGAVLVVTISLLGAQPADQPTTAPARPGVGDKAANFSLQTPDGQKVELHKMTAEGPIVLIVLRGYPGYQCPICTRQVGEFLGSSRKFADAGAKILMVYPGPADGLQQRALEFLKGQALPENVQLVIDPDYTFTNAYGLRWDAPNETAYPSTFVIDRTNTVRFAKVSNDHGGRSTPEEVLKALEGLKR